MELFTVDRSDFLEVGREYKPDRDYSQAKFFPVRDLVEKNEMEVVLDDVFPDGLNSHGKMYLLNECLVYREFDPPIPATPHTPVQELIFELIRRLEFPTRPSRYNSFFAWQTLSEAQVFNSRCAGGCASIKKIETEAEVFLADMKLHYLGGTTIGTWTLARKYWSGQLSSIPMIEVLVPGSIRIIEKIGQPAATAISADALRR